MFVSLTQFRRNPKLNFNDKESLASPAATKVPLPVLDCVSRADEATPHTNFFLMLTETKACSDEAVRLATTPVSTLQEISDILKLKGATKIQFHFRRFRVTCCCKYRGQSFGSSKPNLELALTDLLQRIERGYDFKTKSILKN